VIEDHAFSSDSYAVRSHAALRGFDPDEAILRITPRPGEHCLRDEDVIAFIEDNAERIATVLLGTVNYRTGEYMDVQAITAATRRAGAFAGWDLAHAVGNVPLSLHDWDVDFAAWCSYKYLNSGPGAVAGAFIHQRHLGRPDMPRLEGWWSHRPHSRFEMNPVMDASETADAWALSNPPILAMGPVRTSLAIFDEVGMTALRERSVRLTGYLLALLDAVSDRCTIEVITPREESKRGAQLSIRVPVDAADLSERMHRNWGVTVDDRRPDIIRMAPAPLYTTFHDVWRGADALCRELTGEGLPS
jgi:kynureninase